MSKNEIKATCISCGKLVTPTRTWVLSGGVRQASFKCPNPNCNAIFKGTLTDHHIKRGSKHIAVGGRRNEVEDYLALHGYDENYMWKIHDDMIGKAQAMGLKKPQKMYYRIANRLKLYQKSKTRGQAIRRWYNDNPRPEIARPVAKLFFTRMKIKRKTKAGYEKEITGYQSDLAYVQQYIDSKQRNLRILGVHLPKLSQMWKSREFNKRDPTYWSPKMYQNWELRNYPPLADGTPNANWYRLRQAFRSFKPEFANAQYKDELGCGGQVKSVAFKKKLVTKDISWDRVIEMIDHLPKKYKGIDVELLNKTVIVFALSSGARAGKHHDHKGICGVWLSDYDPTQNQIKEITDKGNTTWKRIILNPVAYDLIQQLHNSYLTKDKELKDYEYIQKNALFHIPELPRCTDCGYRHLDGKYLNFIIKKSCKEIKLTYEWEGKKKLLHAHIMRKLYANWMVNNGTPLDILVDINVGWKTIDTAKDHYIDLKEEYYRSKSKNARLGFYISEEQLEEKKQYIEEGQKAVLGLGASEQDVKKFWGKAWSGKK